MYTMLSDRLFYIVFFSSCSTDNSTEFQGNLFNLNLFNQGNTMDYNSQHYCFFSFTVSQPLKTVSKAYLQEVLRSYLLSLKKGLVGSKAFKAGGDRLSPAPIFPRPH